MPNNGIEFVPCFHENNRITAEPGKSDYILYHGKLSVTSSKSENIKKLNELSREVGEKFMIGDIPGKGEPHKLSLIHISAR